MSTFAVIERQIQIIAKVQGKHIAPLTGGLVLLDSGLDSMSLAILVGRLEDELGVDPFAEADDQAFPTTLGDLVTFYDRAIEARNQP